MTPAICRLCGKPAAQIKPPLTGDWVEFSDYRHRDAGSLDHPKGLLYFCDAHIGAARLLADEESADALLELQSQYGSRPADKTTDTCRVPWWRRWFC